eukprot:53078-Eustigmatos_ZCMA.PRE.1
MGCPLRRASWQAFGSGVHRPMNACAGRNLNQLLLEKPDIVDKPHAPALPPPIKTNGLTLSFDNVSFNYPEQPVDKVCLCIAYNLQMVGRVRRLFA